MVNTVGSEPSLLEPQALARAEMDLAEKFIFEACTSQVAAVSLGAAHIMRAGGKRLRPLVLILVAKACGYEGSQSSARLGAAVELIHTATLVHDDVVDEADTRRGQYAVNTFFGNEASVLMGDYLVCRALRLIAEEPDLDLMREICDVIVSMCEAEVLQIAYRGDLENTFENYLTVIRNKTACLFSFTAMAGAHVAGAPSATCEAMRTFGLNVGIAFQIIDDVLDLLGEQNLLGKPTGSDLLEGKFTYPILHALREAPPGRREELRGLLSRTDQLSQEDLRSVVEMVREAGGFRAALDRAQEYTDRCLTALSEAPPGPALDALRRVVSYVVERQI